MGNISGRAFVDARRWTHTFSTALLMVAVLVLWAASAGAQTGHVEGRVVAEATGEPLIGATVLIQGINDTVRTDQGGRYRFGAVSAGAHVVLARRTGYAPSSRSVSIAADSTVRVNFVLAPLAVGLNPVVVSATRTEQSAEDLPLSTSVVSHEQIEATPADAIDDVVRSIPSVDLSDESSVAGHPTANNLSMRGLGGQRALALLDDVPLNDPFFGYIAWNEIPMEDVDHIEVARGAGSSLYGTYALGGVLAFVTRTPTENELETDVSYGTDNTRRVNVFGSTALGDVARLTVNANYFGTDGWVRPIPSQVGPIDTPAWSDVGNLFAQTDFRLSPHSTAFIRGSFYWFYQNQGSPLQTDAVQSQQLSAGWRTSFSGGGSLRATIFGELDNPDTYNSSPITVRGVNEYLSNIHHTPTNDGGGSVIWTEPLPSVKSTLTLGADAWLISGEDRSLDDSAPNVFWMTENSGGDQEFGGAFGEFSFRPTASWEIQASAREDGWRDYDGHDVTSPGTTTLFPDKSKTRLDPRLAAWYQIVPGVALRAAGYSAFGAPNLDDLYRPYIADGFGVVPNSQLNAETLWGGDGGVELGGSRLKLQLNVFQNTVNDIINYATVATSPNYLIQAFNFGSSRARGTEMILDGALGYWSFEGSWVYTESVITSNPPDTTQVGHTNPDVPKNTVFATISYRRPGRFGAFVRGQYVSKRFTDETDTVVLGEHTLFDVSAFYDFSSRLQVFAQCQNVLDRLYTAEYVGFDARGTPRQLFVGFRTFTR